MLYVYNFQFCYFEVSVICAKIIPSFVTFLRANLVKRALMVYLAPLALR